MHVTLFSCEAAEPVYKASAESRALRTEEGLLLFPESYIQVTPSNTDPQCFHYFRGVCFDLQLFNGASKLCLLEMFLLHFENFVVLDPNSSEGDSVLNYVHKHAHM